MGIIKRILASIKENRVKRLQAMGISQEMRKAMTPHEVELLWYKEHERKDRIKAEALRYRQQYDKEALLGRNLQGPLKRKPGKQGRIKKAPLSGDMRGYW